MVVARGAAQRLLIDQLAEAIEEGGILGGDRDPRQIGLEAERGQFPGGMRQQIDADADRADFGRELEYSAGDSGRVQRQPERQPANTGADDNDVVHVSSPAFIETRLPRSNRSVSLLSIWRRHDG